MLVTRSTLLSHYGASGEALLRSGVLQFDGEDDSLVATDEDEAPSYVVRVDPLRQELGYRNSIGIWIPVEKTSLERFRIDVAALLFALLGDQLRRPTIGLVVIDPGWIWEAGRLRLIRTAPTDIWFARRLSDRQRFDALRAAADRSPTRGRRIVLTSTPRERLPEAVLSNSTIVPVAEVLDPYSPFSIDHARLKARLLGRAAPVTEPLHLSDDGSTLTILGTEIVFGGIQQRNAIRILLDAHKHHRGVNATRTLEEAGYGAGVRLFSQAFKKQWPVLKLYLKSRDELWRFEI